MRDYELVMIVSPEVADEAVPATAERVQEFIAQQGGQVKDQLLESECHTPSHRSWEEKLGILHNHDQLNHVLPSDFYE